MLWKTPKAQLKTMASVRFHPGEAPGLAAILDPHGSPEAVHTLSVLDPEDGHELRQVRLPDVDLDLFEGFSNSFAPILDAVDLDGDGGDELVVTYLHVPWWPSYMVLYEPRIERTRIAFVASGHHRFAGAGDLDGDDRPELLAVGINNRMGWYSGIGAVRLVPPVNDLSSIQTAIASSPDQSYSVSSEQSLLWYSLGPRQRWLDTLAVNPAARTLTLGFMHGRSFVLGFDGFPPGAPSPLHDARRQGARNSAYRHLREVERLSNAGDFANAVAQADRALAMGARASDTRLDDWVRRVRARLLVTAGRVREGEADFEALSRTSEAASDIAYEAGKSLHLAGSLERAISWYRRGLRQGGGKDEGRGKWEYLEGQILALGELKRFDEALGEIDRFSSIYPQMSAFQETFRQYLRWRAGAAPSWKELPSRQGDPDFQRYWILEFRRAAGEDPAGLLRETERELARSSETSPQLLSLKGELLAKLGRLPEALQATLEAYETGKLRRRSLTGVRAHFPLIAERAARLARQTGDEKKARQITRGMRS